MIIEIDNKLRVENVDSSFIKWCKQNLIVSNPEYNKKKRMGFWVGNTPKELQLYEKIGDSYILPYGCLREIKSVNKILYLNRIHKPYHIEFGGEDIKLYNYQKQAVERLKQAEYGILEAPAGSGKSITMIELIKQLKMRALWITHTHDLLEQSKKYAVTYMDNDLIGTITEGKVEIGKGITFATIQTLSKLDLGQYKNRFDVIVVDECHRVQGSPTTLTQFYKVLNNLSAKHKYGMSATIHRADGMIKATLSLLGRVVYTISEEAVADKIMKVGIKPISTNIQIDESCLNVDGTLNYSSLITYLTSNYQRNLIIVKNIIENKNHNCLILSDRLNHLEVLMDLLPKDMKDKAVMVSGKMNTKKGKTQRDKAIEDMRNGNKKYLFATYSLAKEGLDIPILDRLFMASVQKDYAVVTQSIGRIARSHKSKKEAMCYDFIDDIGYCKGAYKKRWTSYRKINCYEVE